MQTNKTIRIDSQIGNFWSVYDVRSKEVNRHLFTSESDAQNNLNTGRSRLIGALTNPSIPASINIDGEIILTSICPRNLLIVGVISPLDGALTYEEEWHPSNLSPRKSQQGN